MAVLSSEELVHLSRARRVVIGSLVAVLVLCCGTAGLAAWAWSRAALSTAGEVDFVNRLAVPPLAPSHVDGSGRRVFDLKASVGTHAFGRSRATTWGFNGSYLGPTLRATRGEQIVVNVHNELPETTTVHWHGMYLPPRMDGGPHQPIGPDATWSPTWLVDQPAATLWYHPHPHGETAQHVYRGLAGMFIVDDPGTDSSGLPHRYGVDDVPVIVQDKRFTDDGALDEDDSGLGGLGILGDTVVVNGTVGPYLDVTTERLRLRLLNASNARFYDFGFADDRSFELVGTDGGLLARPSTTSHLVLSPGERAEIVVTMRSGERAVLRSAPPGLGLDPLSRRFTGADDTLDILELRAASSLEPGADLPPTLASVPRLNRVTAVGTRSFRLSDRSINGERMDMSRIDATVAPDAVEVWTVTNEDGTPHNFHIHGVQFQVLTVDGQGPPPSLAGWKDTIFLTSGTPIELIVPFGSYADPDTPYMFHCHVLLHEDTGMMGQFVVAEPGQPAGAVDHNGHGSAS